MSNPLHECGDGGDDVGMWSTFACRRGVCTMRAMPPRWDKLVVLVSPSFHEQHGCGGREVVCGDDAAVRLVRC
jgi:hypothetical protein